MSAGLRRLRTGDAGSNSGLDMGVYPYLLCVCVSLNFNGQDPEMC